MHYLPAANCSSGLYPWAWPSPAFGMFHACVLGEAQTAATMTMSPSPLLLTNTQWPTLNLTITANGMDPASIATSCTSSTSLLNQYLPSEAVGETHDAMIPTHHLYTSMPTNSMQWVQITCVTTFGDGTTIVNSDSTVAVAVAPPRFAQALVRGPQLGVYSSATLSNFDAITVGGDALDFLAGVRPFSQQSMTYDDSAGQHILEFSLSAQIDGMDLPASALLLSQDGRNLTVELPPFDDVCATTECRNNGLYVPVTLGQHVVHRSPTGSTTAAAAYLTCPSTTECNTSPGLLYVKQCPGSVIGDACISPTAQSCFFGSGEDCMPCPVGAVCPGKLPFVHCSIFLLPSPFVVADTRLLLLCVLASGGKRAWPLPGYWSRGENSTTVLECAPPRARRCQGWVTGRVQCGIDYDSTVEQCAACLPKYYAEDGDCEQCPHDGERARLVMALVFFSAAVGGVALVLYLITMVVFQWHSIQLANRVAMSIALEACLFIVMCMQVIVQLTRVSVVGMPAQVRDVLAIMQLAQGDLFSVAHPECANDVLGLTFILLLVTLLVFLFYFVLRCSSRRHAHWGRNHCGRFRNFILYLLVLAYPLVVTVSWNLALCNSEGGSIPAVPDPFKLCYGENQPYVITAIIMLCIFGVGFPVYLLLSARDKVRLLPPVIEDEAEKDETGTARKRRCLWLIRPPSKCGCRGFRWCYIPRSQYQMLVQKQEMMVVFRSGMPWLIPTLQLFYFVQGFTEGYLASRTDHRMTRSSLNSLLVLLVGVAIFIFPADHPWSPWKRWPRLLAFAITAGVPIVHLSLIYDEGQASELASEQGLGAGLSEDGFIGFRSLSLAWLLVGFLVLSLVLNVAIFSHWLRRLVKRNSSQHYFQQSEALDRFLLLHGQRPRDRRASLLLQQGQVKAEVIVEKTKSHFLKTLSRMRTESGSEVDVRTQTSPLFGGAATQQDAKGIEMKSLGSSLAAALRKEAERRRAAEATAIESGESKGSPRLNSSGNPAAALPASPSEAVGVRTQALFSSLSSWKSNPLSTRRGHGSIGKGPGQGLEVSNAKFGGSQLISRFDEVAAPSPTDAADSLQGSSVSGAEDADLEVEGGEVSAEEVEEDEFPVDMTLPGGVGLAEDAAVLSDSGRFRRGANRSRIHHRRVSYNTLSKTLVKRKKALSFLKPYLRTVAAQAPVQLVIEKSPSPTASEAADDESTSPHAADPAAPDGNSAADETQLKHSNTEAAVSSTSNQ